MTVARILVLLLVLLAPPAARPESSSSPPAVPLVVCRPPAGSAVASENDKAAPGATGREADGGDDGGWRESLPPVLRRGGAPLHRLRVPADGNGGGGVTVYLLGSSHVSESSAEDVEALMDHVRPDAVFVELCDQRVGMMLDEHELNTAGDGGGEPADRNDGGGDPSSFGSVGRVADVYTKMQADIAAKLNVTVGGELRQAYRSALGQHRQYVAGADAADDGGAHPRGSRPCAIVLGDRPVQITLVRTWESLRLWGRIKLVACLIWGRLRPPSEKELREWMESVLSDRTGESDLLTKSIEDMARHFPSVKTVIIDERDEYMSAKLEQTCRALGHGRDSTVVVAVVGAGHCPGMVRRLLPWAGEGGEDCGGGGATTTAATTSPEQRIRSVVGTRRRIPWLDEDGVRESLVTDIVHFDYSCLTETEGW